MPDTTNTAVSDSVQLLSDQDLYLFNEGSNYRIYDKMGAHLRSRTTAQPAPSSAYGRRMRVPFPS